MILDGLRNLARKALQKIRIPLIRRYGLRLKRQRRKLRNSTRYGKDVIRPTLQGNIRNDSRRNFNSRRPRRGL
jgi:hypothetical protein